MLSLTRQTSVHQEILLTWSSKYICTWATSCHYSISNPHCVSPPLFPRIPMFVTLLYYFSVILFTSSKLVSSFLSDCLCQSPLNMGPSSMRAGLLCSVPRAWNTLVLAHGCSINVEWTHCRFVVYLTKIRFEFMVRVVYFRHRNQIQF